MTDIYAAINNTGTITDIGSGIGGTIGVTYTNITGQPGAAQAGVGSVWSGAAWSAPPPPHMIGALAFIERFTAAEQTALIAANPLWAIKIAAAGTIDTTNATLLADLQAAVTAGALTSARAAQVVNLGVSSP